MWEGGRGEDIMDEAEMGSEAGYDDDDEMIMPYTITRDVTTIVNDTTTKDYYRLMTIEPLIQT